MALFTVTTADDVVDAGDGQLSLREAVAQANATSAADAIQFAAALETGGALVLEQGQLFIQRDVTIDGDSNNNGSEVTLTVADDPETSEPVSRVFNINNDTTDVSLRDLTVAETGLFGDATAFPGGGAILLAEGSLTVAGCTFRDTDVPASLDFQSSGGAIEASSGTKLVISASSFTDCSAAVGGAIYSNEGAEVVVIDSVFTSGDARSSGGAIDASGRLVIRSSEFIDNYTEGNTGGAISFSDGLLSIEDSQFKANVAGIEYRNGSEDVIAIFDATATIARSAIVESTDSGLGGGGGIGAYDSRVLVTDSTVVV